MTAQQIKDIEAIKLGYSSFRDLVINPNPLMAMEHLQTCIGNSMSAYARLQIEKDRERVKENVETIDVGFVDIRSIDNTPIIID